MLFFGEAGLYIDGETRELMGKGGLLLALMDKVVVVLVRIVSIVHDGVLDMHGLGVDKRTAALYMYKARVKTRCRYAASELAARTV